MARKTPVTPELPSASQVLSDKLVTQGLRRLISQRYGGDTGAEREWALFFELRNGTGYGGQTRYVDAFALNLWPSKRHWRVAMELKASRGDFLRELDKPEKRQWGVEISNEFWYVCGPGVAKEGEVPEGCGLLVADESLSKLRKVRAAPQREARELTLTEVAAFARKTGERQGLLFQHSGKELDEAALEVMLEARMDDFLRAKVSARVERDMRNQLATVRNVLGRYARDMRSVGIQPPTWMEQEVVSSESVWNAADWAKDAFVKGPGLDAVLDARKTLARTQRELESAQRHLKEVADAVEALVPSLPAPTAPADSGDLV